MRLTIDTDARTLSLRQTLGRAQVYDLHSKEAFNEVSKVWITQQWSQLCWHSFSWMGFQFCQLPEDVLRLQEVILRVRPDVIIETGINNGGSTAFFASMCILAGRGRVYSVDISVPPEVRTKLETSSFGHLLNIVQGDSTDPAVVDQWRASIKPGENVFVFLDSDHSKRHVLRELELYADLVTVGSYIVATDGIMESLTGAPYAEPDWATNNPAAAARGFARKRADFVLRRPDCLFGDQYYNKELTYWPDAWLQKIAV